MCIYQIYIRVLLIYTECGLCTLLNIIFGSYFPLAVFMMFIIIIFLKILKV